MKNIALSISFMVLAPNLYAEVNTKAFSGTGTLDSVDVEASVTTTVRVFPASMDVDKARDAEAEPFPVNFDWQVSWDTETPNVAVFKADLILGDYFTVTDAGTMGGVSIQAATGVVHHIGGKAQWDAGTRTLSYEVELKKRSDSRASKTSQKADPTCDGATIACNAFLNTTPELEGLTVNLVFDESLSSFTGSMAAIQYEGAFFTKNQTDMNISVEGQLVPAE
jgi:hypothetical protein